MVIYKDLKVSETTYKQLIARAAYTDTMDSVIRRLLKDASRSNNGTGVDDAKAREMPNRR
jgi:hypothetical protein